jgi:penicillin-binding protein 1C
VIARDQVTLRALWRWTAWACAGATLLAAAWFLWPGAVPEFSTVRAEWRPSEAWLLDRHGRVLDQQRLDFTVRRYQWVTLDAVSPAVVAAIIHGEDRRFLEHGGVDWRGVLAAARDTVLRDRRRGASTITMQVAQLVHQTRAVGGPAWWRKLRQMRAARALEARWSKTQILEAYLNLLGFRGELQGIGAAAAVLAGKAPAGLDHAESIVLAALLPAPGATLEDVSRRACARSAAVQPAVDCSVLAATAQELLQRRRPPLAPPRLAPQLAQRMLRQAGESVTSTLDARVQRLAMEALAHQLAQVADRNVRDGAVLVVDTQSGDVLAYVASGGTASSAGEVDGIRAQRQAGSTLKPFLYGLAIERGYLTAASLLDDAPVNLDTASGLYIPQNYDRDFKGLVSVRSALGNSLNVPAVRALVLTGVDALRERLFDLGYASIARDGDYYGFSLALGSAEVSLWEQAQAYRTLARGGRFAPLRLQLAAPPPVERVAFPASAGFVVADILADRAARALTFGPDSALNTPYWSAVKTGTSKDMRDNWCIGFSSRFLVAAWVGNFEGDSMHDVSGVTGAAPVWAELMEQLHRDGAGVAPQPPQEVVAVTVSFTPAVEAARREWFVVGTEQQQVRGVTTAAALARIESPTSGTVIALDPDIPESAQRLPLRARGSVAGLRFRLDEAVLGDAAQPVMWSPRPGYHLLVLEDGEGRVVDHVRFTVR